MAPELHCTKQSSVLEQRPAGSATRADRFILVELPLPWPGDIEAHPLLRDAAVPSAGDERSTRLLAVHGTETGTRQETVRIIVLTADEPFSGYGSVERSVPPTDVAPTVAAARSGDLSGFAPTAPGTTDVLICTHGTRDRCCGHWGTLLFVELTGRFGPGVRLWRTSHTGGHRFAPTAITFPDGFAWAWLDADRVESIVSRSGDTGALAGHMRGCSYFGPVEQVADGAALALHGWSWLDHPRRVSVAEPPGEGVAAAGPRTITATATSIVGASYGVTVVESEPVPVPVCGEPLRAARKTSRQFALGSVRRIGAGS